MKKYLRSPGTGADCPISGYERTVAYMGRDNVGLGTDAARSAQRTQSAVPFLPAGLARPLEDGTDLQFLVPSLEAPLPNPNSPASWDAGVASHA